MATHPSVTQRFAGNRGADCWVERGAASLRMLAMSGFIGNGGALLCVAALVLAMLYVAGIV